ncbi:MAG: protein kinase, partial [Pseudomonadota bacterium]
MKKSFETFGNYILLEKLAAGGMAEVYLAKKMGASGVQKFVAIKRILQQFSDSKDFIAMFKDEAKIAINLSHSNVVTIYDFGMQNSQFYIAMEFVEGRNLRQILNRMKRVGDYFSVAQVVHIVRQVAAGLDHA